ncbi:MAG TPA: ankyrin repeat domain-containing protein [Terriglobales bacterium]|jgi:ankyrin repeat protein|nr:ankyrin repeat domain-containing protein [Terriglobales bacterium]
MHEAFFAAVKAGNSDEVMKQVAANPALLTARDESGVTAVLVAAYHRQEALARALADRKPDLGLFEAAVLGKVERAATLLDADPSLLDSFSPDGWTALHLAAFFNRLEMVELLLARGAKVDLKSKNALNNTPLNAAVAANRLEIARRLLQKGADANAHQHGGITPLHEAAASGNAEMVRLLLAHRADASAISEDNRTPLGMALEKGHQPVVDILQPKVAVPDEKS